MAQRQGKESKSRLPSKQGYHHGQLREALVAAARELINQFGPRGFSMSQACRLTSVSPAALYRHFASKEALLAEVARIGFLALAEAIGEPSSGRTVAALRGELVAAGVAYVLFAKKRPAEFRAMFAAGIDKEQFPELTAAAQSAFGRLTEITERAIVAGAIVERDAHTAASATWATAHGLAMLAVEDAALVLPPKLVESALQSVVNGMGRPLG